MKYLIMIVVAMALTSGVVESPTFPENPFKTNEAGAAIKWVNSSRCKNGGYYRDTSNDGNSYNNANTLGWN